MEEVNFQKQYSLRSNQFHRQLKNYTRDSKPKSLPFRVQQIMYPQLVNVPRKPGQVDCYGWWYPVRSHNTPNKKIFVIKKSTQRIISIDHLRLQSQRQVKNHLTRRDSKESSFLFHPSTLRRGVKMQILKIITLILCAQNNPRLLNTHTTIEVTIALQGLIYK